MKAIHNALKGNVITAVTVFIPTKIQNESNSQQLGCISFQVCNCIYPYKDTK